MAGPIQSPGRGPGTAGRSGYLPVSEHGLIGDMHSVALVGTNGTIGIKQAAARFVRSGNINQLNADITRIAGKVPFGRAELLPTWQANLQALQAGTFTPTSSGFSWGLGATGTAIANTLYEGLQNYLADGIGTSFNILKSNIHWRSDNLLTYNQRVGSNRFT